MPNLNQGDGKAAEVLNPPSSSPPPAAAIATETANSREREGETTEGVRECAVVVQSDRRKSTPRSSRRNKGERPASTTCNAHLRNRPGRFCRQSAGHRTDHEGVGRCWLHGGRSGTMKHGRYSFYSGLETRGAREGLGEMIERFKSDPDQLSILEELATARALFAAWMEQNRGAFETDRGANASPVTSSPSSSSQMLASSPSDPASPVPETRTGPPEALVVFRVASDLLGDVTRIAARIERIRSNNAVSVGELYRVMREMGRVVETFVRDPEILERITAGWLTIQVQRATP